MSPINSIANNVNEMQPSVSQWKQGVSPAEAHATFSNQLKEAIAEVNKAQTVSDDKTKALARGEVEDLHDVMVTSQKASIMMQTTVEMQSKVVEAYKEIMRMQV